jgi:hypothetical protein
MQYALLIYNAAGDPPSDLERPMDPRIAAILKRPEIVTWARLRHPGSTTTLKSDGGRRLLVDGPFVDSKEYLGGLIVIEADNLDKAIAIADELQDTRAAGGAIEIRPMLT